MQERIIWSNFDYDEWLESVKDELPKEEINERRFHEDCDIWLGDERMNLDVKIDGVIVGFAILGLWDGKHQGCKIFDNNIKDILKSRDDFVKWYCDRYNVRGKGVHHDGTNMYLYRIAKNEKAARKLERLIIDGKINEKAFMRRTKSLRPFVAKIYGW